MNRLMIAILLLLPVFAADARKPKVSERDVFYITFRTRAHPKQGHTSVRNKAMVPVLYDLKKRMGLHKRKMKYLRIGFQLPSFYRNAMEQTDTYSNRALNGYHREVDNPRFKMKPVIEADPRNYQWFETNENAAGKATHFGQTMACMSRYCEDHWNHWRQLLDQRGKAAITSLDGNFPLIHHSGPGEPGLNNGVPMKRNSPPKHMADYSPFMIKEFRDWLTHRGIYSRKGPFRGQGWKDGKEFYDDPSPAKRRGRNKKSFNETFGTDFTTWDVKYWDPDKFKDMPRNAPHMPNAGEKGFIAGGFDAPRKQEPGNAFWDVWSNAERENAGFRQISVHNYVNDTLEYMSKKGIPRDRLYTHTCVFPDPKRIPAELLEANWSLPHRIHLQAAPMWVATTPFGRPGFTMYGDIARSDAAWQQMWELLDKEEKKYHKFAITEYHPYPHGEEAENATVADFSKALSLVKKYRPHALVVCGWEGNTFGGRYGYETKDTPFEEALRKMIAEWPDKPFWKVPDPMGKKKGKR